MKTITIDNEKLLKLLSEKETLVNKGRSTSEEIEKVEKRLDDIDKEMIELEKGVDIKDLDERAQLATDAFNKAVEQMEEIKKEIYERMSKLVPKELKTEYEELSKTKDTLEKERNKIALKAQKYTDKIIPLARKEMAKFLEDEFDDFESLKLENGIIKGIIFNQVEEFKNNYRKRQEK